MNFNAFGLKTFFKNSLALYNTIQFLFFLRYSQFQCNAWIFYIFYPSTFYLCIQQKLRYSHYWRNIVWCMQGCIHDTGCTYLRQWILHVWFTLPCLCLKQTLQRNMQKNVANNLKGYRLLIECFLISLEIIFAKWNWNLDWSEM